MIRAFGMVSRPPPQMCTSPPIFPSSAHLTSLSAPDSTVLSRPSQTGCPDFPQVHPCRKCLYQYNIKHPIFRDEDAVISCYSPSVVSYAMSSGQRGRAQSAGSRPAPQEALSRPQSAQSLQEVRSVWLSPVAIFLLPVNQQSAYSKSKSRF